MNEHDARSIGWVLACLLGPPFPPFPALRVCDLSPERMVSLGKAVGRVLAEARRRGRQITDSEAYLIALDMFGCVCPHIPGDDAEAYRGELRFRCMHCRAGVVTPFEFPRRWLEPHREHPGLHEPVTMIDPLTPRER